MTEKAIRIGNIYPSKGENGNIWWCAGCSPTLKAGTGVVGNGIGSCNAPKVMVKTKGCGELWDS